VRVPAPKSVRAAWVTVETCGEAAKKGGRRATGPLAMRIAPAEWVTKQGEPNFFVRHIPESENEGPPIAFRWVPTDILALGMASRPTSGLRSERASIRI